MQKENINDYQFILEVIKPTTTAKQPILETDCIYVEYYATFEEAEAQFKVCALLITAPYIIRITDRCSLWYMNGLRLLKYDYDGKKLDTTYL